MWLPVAVVVLALAVAGGLLYLRQRDAAAHERQRQAQRVVQGFLASWSRGDAAAAAGYVPAAQQAAARDLLTATRRQLRVAAASYRLRGRVSSTARPGGSYEATVQVAGVGSVRWTGRVPLRRVGGRWRVAFSPAVVHPALRPGGRFVVARASPPRGKVLLADGTSMASDTDLSLHLRGRVERVRTAAQAKAAGPLVATGDLVGVSGLQRVYDDTLRGRPGGRVQVLDASGVPTATLLDRPAVGGRDVRTTLDGRVQRAGEAAVAGVPQPGALVALSLRTGRVLALVDHPVGGLSRAIAGKGPPGSTFKIVTAAAALMGGVPADTVLNCSPSVVIDGRRLTNAENEAFGPIPFQRAFAVSCNTWFARLQGKVSIDRLTSTAALFGFATNPDPAKAQQAAEGILPIRSFGGIYPRPADRAQAAGQAFGQDLVLASPLQMASVAAAVGSGVWRQPAVTPDARVRSNRLPASVAATLRRFMAAVTQPGGTAAQAGLPPNTYGKTGTAETAASARNPDALDSWFVGFRGDVAFAVTFERAGFGAEVAAPAAARFLRALG